MSQVTGYLLMMAEPPSTLHQGRISLTRKLGEGGMALVFEAYDHDLTVWRAVKFLRPELAGKKSIRRRFMGEAQALAKLDHPHIVRVYDVGEEEGWPFILMSLTRGGSLEDFLAREGRMQPRQAAEVMIDVCEGVQAAHDAGIVHRDLKPDNVLITKRGVCQVTDFGIAIVDESLRRTRTGSVMGTLGYMAPEQQRDAKNLDARADVYSLGSTLYALVTGEQPTDLHMVALEEDMLDAVPEEMKPIIATATAYRPSERYASVAALRDALKACISSLPVLTDSPALARPVGATKPPPRTQPPNSRAPATPPPEEPSQPTPLPYKMPMASQKAADPDAYIDHDADEKARRKREALEKLARIERERRDSIPPQMRENLPPTHPPDAPEAPLPPAEAPGEKRTVEPEARQARPALGPDDVAEAAQDAAQATLDLFIKALKPLWPGLVALALLFTIFTGLLMTGAYQVRSAAAEAHDAEQSFMQVLAKEVQVVDDLKAMGVRDDTLPVMKLQMTSTHDPKQKVALGIDLMKISRKEHEKARFTTPSGLQHRVESARDRLDRLEASHRQLERKQAAWDEAASRGLGSIAVAVGAASAPD